jgi:hypothetical protein
MKKHEFLALKKHEFHEMVEAIASKRATLKLKKKSDDSIKLTCHVGIPVSHINFKTEEQGENLLVTRRLNLFPLFYSTLPILILLEVIVFLISYFRGGSNNLIYYLIVLAWVVAVAFLIYQTFAEIEEIVKKLYRVEV